MKFPDAVAGFVVFAFFILAGNANSAWPEFRGPRGDGHVPPAADGKPIGLPLLWSETNNIKWKTEIPHKGISTPVVLDGQVWLTTADEDGRELFAICIDKESGKVVHDLKLFDVPNPNPLFKRYNSYASPTPAIEEGRVYVSFGASGIACLDTKTGDGIMAMFDELHAQGQTIIVVTHEEYIAERAQRTVRLRDGKIESDVVTGKPPAATPAFPRTADSEAAIAVAP